jgi:hypothetical protein
MFNDPEVLKIIIGMANASMYRKEDPIVLGNNMEGALLLHMAF